MAARSYAEAPRTKRPVPPSTGAVTDIPSAHPTTLPTANDNEALLVLQRSGIASIPLDLAVPVMTGGSTGSEPAPVSREVFAYVDGLASLSDIAALMNKPLPEVLGCVLDLLGAGMVDVVGPDIACGSSSGVYDVRTGERVDE